MIINSHVHVNTLGNYFYYPDYNFNRFLEEMHKNKIDIAFPALNPKLELFRCPNSSKDSNNFKEHGGINSSIELKGSSNKHRIQVVEKNNHMLLQCNTCGYITYEGSIDPLRKYNQELIAITSPYRRTIKPLIYVLLCKSTIQNEIDFWENNYPNDFVGFKLHPWNDQVSVADFKVHSSKPFLIHTGIRDLESAKNAIAFAKGNPTLKVVIAHAGALDTTVLNEIGLLENVFIDCCPSTFMFESRFSALYSPEHIFAPEDIYWKVLKYLPSHKILFGTDSPWGDTQKELEVIRNLNATPKVKEQILFKNAARVYGLSLY